MLFTDARAHRLNQHTTDSTSHIFGNCSTVHTAISSIYNQLKLPTPPTHYLKSRLLCVEPTVATHSTAFRKMIVNTVWRACTEAGHGKISDSWNNWIVEDCLTRIGILNVNPNYFNTYFTRAIMFIFVTNLRSKRTLAAQRAPVCRKLALGR